jgi:hypothetical protein
MALTKHPPTVGMYRAGVVASVWRPPCHSSPTTQTLYRTWLATPSTNIAQAMAAMYGATAVEAIMVATGISAMKKPWMGCRSSAAASSRDMAHFHP